jgi:hypothetical protein
VLLFSMEEVIFSCIGRLYLGLSNIEINKSTTTHLKNVLKASTNINEDNLHKLCNASHKTLENSTKFSLYNANNYNLFMEDRGPCSDLVSHCFRLLNYNIIQNTHNSTVI